MLANQAEFPVRVMSRVLNVSSSGFYAWKARRPSRRCLDNAILRERIRGIYIASDATYGMPRVRAELIDQGEQVSRKQDIALTHALRFRGLDLI